MNNRKKTYQSRFEATPIRQLSCSTLLRLTIVLGSSLLWAMTSSNLGASPVPLLPSERELSCIPPTIGTRVARDTLNCYQSELTLAERELRDLHRDMYNNANFEERRTLRELETTWRTLRDLHCSLIRGQETDINQQVAVTKFCQAVLTRNRIAVMRTRHRHLLEQPLATNPPAPSLVPIPLID